MNDCVERRMTKQHCVICVVKIVNTIKKKKKHKLKPYAMVDEVYKNLLTPYEVIFVVKKKKEWKWAVLERGTNTTVNSTKAGRPSVWLFEVNDNWHRE